MVIGFWIGASYKTALGVLCKGFFFKIVIGFWVGASSETAIGVLRRRFLSDCNRVLGWG